MGALLTEAAPADSTRVLALRSFKWSDWRVIWVAGGLCWLIAAVSQVLWALPLSGKTLLGKYYFISSDARLLQYLLVFLLAGFAYRAAMAIGWPGPLPARARVVLINALLALAVALSSRLAAGLVERFVDGNVADMWDTFTDLKHILSAEVWGNPLCFFLSPYLMGLGAIALVKLAERNQREAVLATRLSADYAEARLSMLSAQLQPHFLFNSLHAITRLIDESPAEAATMVARLGDFLRHALETSRTPWVNVATELSGLEAYLEVQRVRYSDHLTVSFDVSSAVLGLSVPSLLLQPLAENAIEHGRAVGKSLVVRVAAMISADRLRFVISNGGPPLAAPLLPGDYCLGLSNVELRLHAAYGDEARLTVGPDDQGGTVATLDLPARRHAQMTAHARLRL
ncbi:MAG TPA: histidine kinase [Steroidobacteraceae bacterium]|nr:histidine kinase [Steroidobacteraceae bacterium]